MTGGVDCLMTNAYILCPHLLSPQFLVGYLIIWPCPTTVRKRCLSDSRLLYATSWRHLTLVSRIQAPFVPQHFEYLRPCPRLTHSVVLRSGSARYSTFDLGASGWRFSAADISSPIYVPCGHGRWTVAGFDSVRPPDVEILLWLCFSSGLFLQWPDENHWIEETRWTSQYFGRALQWKTLIKTEM